MVQIDKVQVMVTSHYLSQWWPSSPICVNEPQWVENKSIDNCSMILEVELYEYHDVL